VLEYQVPTMVWHCRTFHLGQDMLVGVEDDLLGQEVKSVLMEVGCWIERKHDFLEGAGCGSIEAYFVGLARLED
jgi:hypothetical protein